jgi:hypothetical protein
MRGKAGVDPPGEPQNLSSRHAALSSSARIAGEMDESTPLKVPNSPVLASSLRGSKRRDENSSDNPMEDTSSVSEKASAKFFSIFSLFGWGGGPKTDVVAVGSPGDSNSRSHPASVQSTPEKSMQRQRRAFQQDWKHIHYQVQILLQRNNESAKSMQ